VTHCWLKGGQIILGAPSGQIQVYENDRLLQTIDCGVPVTSLQQYGEGFMVGGKGKNFIIYEPQIENENFEVVKAREIAVHDQAPDVQQLSLSPNEDAMCYRSEDHQIMLLRFPQPPKETVDDAEGAVAPPTFDPALWRFKPTLPSVHQGRILSMDTCYRKPYVATIGSDRTLRIWNYLTNKCELVKSFQEDVYSVALHPSGMYIMIGFSDKLRLMNLLSDDVRLYKEYGVRSCREVRIFI
jgi:WD40 repeat protein